MNQQDSGSLLDARIRAVWRRTQLLHASAGLLALCRWAIPIFVIAIVIDRPSFLPAVVRSGILIALLFFAFYKAWRCGWQKLRGFNSTHLALQIEQQQGGLESLLVTAVQFKENKVSGTSSAMRDKTCAIAEERVASLRPEEVAPYSNLQRPGLIAFLFIGILTFIGLLDGPFLKTGLQRIFTPWVAIEYPTDTHLSFENEELIVKQGDKTTIKALVSGVIPKQAKLSLRTGNGKPLVRQIEITDGACSYSIKSASRDFTYRIHAGDARSQWRKVKVIPAPRLKKISALLTYPAYLNREPETLSSLTITVPEDTHIKWTLTLNSPLNKASLLRDGAEPVSLSLSEDKQTVSFSEVAKESKGYRFAWVETKHNYSFFSPRHYLQVAPDRAPSIELTQPKTNLHAILGRELQFKVRARDDHGIADTHISYRVNLRPKESFKLKQDIANGKEQSIDWDYRKTLSSLKIGDSVAFSFKVSDRYAGPGGPHTAQTDTKRVSFLSKEDYLAQIAKRKERLLSQIRGIYRQERAAHDLILKVNPKDESYEQTAQLESSRQEMLRGQLNDAVIRVQELIDDLAANGVSDAPEGDMLETLRKQLKNIADQHVSRAGELLRESTNPLLNGGVSSIRPAAAAIDLAARELALLVLQRDINAALEVFAREVHAIAMNSASFRSTAVSYDIVNEQGQEIIHNAKQKSELMALSKEIKNLAIWTRDFLTKLQAGLQYRKRPLAILNLTRRIKELRLKGIADSMDLATEHLNKSEVIKAMASQEGAIAALLEAEARMRRGVEYKSLLSVREQLFSIRRQFKVLNAGDNNTASEAKRQALRSELAGLMLPSVPAPSAQLFDTQPPKKPMIRALLSKAQRAMVHKKDQVAATEALEEIIEIINNRTKASLIETAGVGEIAAGISEWAMQITDFETRQIGLLEKVDIAAVDGKPCAPLFSAQQTIAKDIARFKKDILRENKKLKLSTSDLTPLLGRLDNALHSIKNILQPLKENKHDLVIEMQDIAAAQLANIIVKTESQGERYSMLENLFTQERDVYKASRFIEDIAAEQSDIITTLKKAKPEDFAKLMPSQINLRRCLFDVAPLVELVSGQMDIGTPLAFSGSDMEDALEALKEKDQEEALDALDVTYEAMEKVTSGMLVISRQVGYVGEIVDALNGALGKTGFAAFQQEEMKNVLSADLKAIPKQLKDNQRAMESHIQQLDTQNMRIAGSMANILIIAPDITKAAMALEKGDQTASREQMTLAVDALDKNTTQFLTLIEVVYGLPQFLVTALTSDEEKLLLRVLSLASDHHHVYRLTQAADNKTVKKLVQKQQAVIAQHKAFGKPETLDPKLINAHKHLIKALEYLKASARDKALVAQEKAETDLRHYIITQAFILETAVAEAASSEDSLPSDASAEAGGSDVAKASGEIGAFVGGEVPKDKEIDWETLKQRGRAALHENFARELPLEYRGMLKSYFEKVAK